MPLLAMLEVVYPTRLQAMELHQIRVQLDHFYFYPYMLFKIRFIHVCIVQEDFSLRFKIRSVYTLIYRVGQK
jgi:hypothetical protein